jgi:lysozyme family protein
LAVRRVTLFDAAFSIVVGVEGGLSTDPRDPGNWRDVELVGTKYGVAAAYHPGVDVRALTLEGAKAIHLAEYWRPCGADVMPARAALCAYDAAINQGVPTAVRLMQSACGLVADGEIGLASRSAFAKIGAEQLGRFMTARALRYARTKGFDIDGAGWIGRLFTAVLAPLPV